MARLFGTDGVRGLANRQITAQLALELGEAAARALAQGGEGRPRAVVARDTRLSGAMLAQAVAGVDVEQVDVLPTPGLAYLTASQNIDLGVMISASHNPMPDNGIKFFARGGFKLEDSIEDEVEALLGAEWDRPVGEGVGRIESAVEMADSAYIEHLVGSIDVELTGLRIVVDCANGATSAVAPTSSSSTPRPTGTTSTTNAGLPIPNSSSPPSSLPGLISVSPSTATPTAASPWTPRARWSTGIRSWAFSPLR